MASDEYERLLQHPRWQRKRLEMFNRDNWKCTVCGDTENNLQVHHRFYIKGNKPWEYEDSCFVTMCKKCHKKEHDLIPDEEPERKYQSMLDQQNTETLDSILKKQIIELKNSLKKGVSPELEEDILKNIIFLQGKRKEYGYGNL